MDRMIVSRKSARNSGLLRYFTGKPCKRGHIAERLVSSSTCLVCANILKKKSQKKHRNEYLAYQREYQKLRRNLKEKSVSCSESRHRQYFEANRGKFNHLQNKRRAIKLNALPAWVNLSKVEKMYEKAAYLTENTGESYHVDHIVPLQGKNVCGLHVEYNLQIIRAKDNLKKGNRHGRPPERIFSSITCG